MIPKKRVYLRVILLSLFGVLGVSLISLFCFVELSEMVVEDYRYGYMMYVGKKLEKSAEDVPIERINIRKFAAHTVPSKNALAFLNITETRPTASTQKPQSPSVWLISESGEIISSNGFRPLPIAWDKMPHPRLIHEIESTDHYFLQPKTFIIKLNTNPHTYLVTHNERALFQGPFLWVQGLHTFTTAAFAVFLALSLSFYYLRKKSTEARQVLAQLESGNLKARFEIKRFDQFGSLILDFNRMADEIERLVKRLNDTEKTRSNLLQELGHDLRTPLTSLGTNFETLKAFHEVMRREEREELLLMIESDIEYFQALLDKMTMIASIDEIHYRPSSEKVNISEIIDAEIKNRQVNISNLIIWEYDLKDDSGLIIVGDNHLIIRLIKNAFDNAARYAREKVSIQVKKENQKIELTIIDDGPGLSAESLITFGKRREQRQRREKQGHHFSLGLGSVIMKTIAQVHGGEIRIENTPKGGACLRVILKSA